MASFIGLGPVIEMWKKSQKLRSQDQIDLQKPLLNIKLSDNSKEMLTAAVKIFNHENKDKNAKTETLINCLHLSGLVKKDAKSPEFTWYKLPEWLQVEYVQIFGSYMHHQPWYQFPFGEMIQVLKRLFSRFSKELTTLALTDFSDKKAPAHQHKYTDRSEFQLSQTKVKTTPPPAGFSRVSKDQKLCGQSSDASSVPDHAVVFKFGYMVLNQTTYIFGLRIKFVIS